MEWILLRLGHISKIRCKVIGLKDRIILVTGAVGQKCVERIPSLGILDLAEYMAAECRTKVLGIWQGKKIHEPWISLDEARNTLAPDGCDLIKPDDPFFEFCMDSEGFEYNSKINNDWVTKDRVNQMVAAIRGDI